MAGNAKAREALFALREHIARLEGKALPVAPASGRPALHPIGETRILDMTGAQNRLPFGVSILDEAREIRSRSLYDAGAATGFALSLAARLNAMTAEAKPVLWIADGFSVCEAGALHAGGMGQFGIDPYAFYHATPRKLDDALWLAEAGLRSGVFSATILIVHGNPKSFGLTESRRLSLRARAVGQPLFLLRHAGDEEASSAPFRLFVEPAPALERRLADGSMLGGSIGHPVFKLTLEKSRNPAPLSFFLEWNPRDRQFHLARDTRRSSLFQRRPADSGALLPLSANRQDRTQALGSVLAFERAS
jgi:protein ImuA